MNRTGSGQSTIEYVIVVAIMVGLIVLVLGKFKRQVHRAQGHLSGQINASLQ
jgi:hypothetical protein